MDIERTVDRMELEGARAQQSCEGLEEAKSISNYVIGNDPSRWIPGVPNHRTTAACRVCGDDRKLGYDFVVRSSADPGGIHLAYARADSLTTYYLEGSGIDRAYSIGAWSIPPSTHLDARNSRENLCNGF